MDRARYLVGLITLAFAIAGAVFLWRLLEDHDSTGRFKMQVEFKSLRGLKAGADVRYRGVTVGSVRNVRLAEDGMRAVAELVLDAGQEKHCCVGSRFWIVAPRFSGITGGATGLETLIRDAYVAFVTPDTPGPQLPNGCLSIGQELPAPDDDGIPVPARGDLVMTVLVPDSHGLQPGSRVMYRGMRIGNVASLDLAENGTHVRVGVRIDRAQRRTITDKTRFWIARPRLTGALLSGLEVQDLGSLLGPYLACHSEPGEGVPVADGHVALGSAEHPDLKVAEVSAAALTAAGPASRGSAAESKLQLVRVVYAGVGTNWWSADDPEHRDSSGLLYVDGSGRTVVLTARSGVDAGWCVRDIFGIHAKFKDERFRVVLSDGVALRAGRVWVAPGDVDLALLLVEDPPREAVATPRSLMGFGGPGSGSPLEVWSSTEAGPLPAQELDPKALPAVAKQRGALVLERGSAVGVLGQKAPRDTTTVIVPFAALPEDLRPRE